MSWLDERRLLVCVGPGGVGKTTVAAALAVASANSGRRVALLTIDPAKRLADALGLDGLSDELTRVDLPGLGELHAAMLDTQSSYDALMTRLGKDEQSTKRILSNPVYRAFSRTLARSHAYIAMERLHDLVQSQRFDFIVVDTPPTRSALDILDAPDNLARFLDDDVVRWFLTPRSRGPLSQLIPRGGAAVTRILSLLASRRLVDELSEFFRVLLHLRAGFQQRAEGTKEILRSPTTAFALVTAPVETSLADAEYLRAGLAERGVSVDAIVFNRAFDPSASDLTQPLDLPPSDAGTDSPWEHTFLDDVGYPPEEQTDSLVSLVRALRTERERAATSNRNSLARARQFCASMPVPPRVAKLPRLDGVVASLESVEQLSRTIRWQETESAFSDSTQA